MMQKESRALKALEAIAFYIRNYRPKGEQALAAQLKVVEEMAVSAIEEKEQAA